MLQTGYLCVRSEVFTAEYSYYGFMGCDTMYSAPLKMQAAVSPEMLVPIF